MIALGLFIVSAKKFFETQKTLTFRSPFQHRKTSLSNLMASSTALQLGKSSWPSVSVSFG